MEKDAPELPEPLVKRRRLLAQLSILGAAVSGIAASATSVMAFLSPALRKPSEKAWTRVMDDVNTVDIGIPFRVDFAESVDDAWIQSQSLRSVWLYTEDAVEFKAFSGVCTHLGCRVSLDTDKQRFHCPCLHGLFDMRTGEVLGGPPPRALDLLPVKVEDGEVHVRYQSFRAGVEAKIEV